MKSIYNQARFKPTGHRRPVHRPREYEQPELEIEKVFLKDLHLQYNSLNSIPDLSEYHSVEFIDLGFNRIPYFEDSFDVVADTLKRLDLGYNTEFNGLGDSLKNLVNLEWLTLSGNDISDLGDSLNSLVNLTHLELQFNKFETLGDSLDGLNKLEKLNLWSNNFKKIDGCFDNLPSLKSLCLDANPIAYFRHLRRRPRKYIKELKKRGVEVGLKWY
jgi:Leucine-rich repeat (LRR) protein